MSDWFYRAFEDRYRGARSVIRSRLTAYLPFVAPLSQSGAAVALDLGCGRGEWLELLDEAGFIAEGVDLDEGMLDACRERGLRATHGDALEILRLRADCSVAVVSAFHLVEHIAFAQVQTLISEALRVLQPGGLLIMETPNPENLVVGTSSFYDDPSHLRPLPPKLLAFAVEFGGFARHTVLRLQESTHIREAGPLTLFDVLAGVSPDYGVVAQKAAPHAQMATHDAIFATRHGIDLHEVAQHYEQQQDDAREQLRQVRDRQATDATVVQEQLAIVDAQMAHVHQATIAIATNIAGIEAVLADIKSSDNRFTERHEQLTMQLGSLREQFADQFGGLNEQVGSLTKRVSESETMVRRTEAYADRAIQLMKTQAAGQLRSEVEKILQSHQRTVEEAARLAAHVAWLEGRLTHMESQSEMFRTQLSALQQRRSALASAAHLIGKSRRLLALAASPQFVRVSTTALVRQTVRLVLRRPALKRVARRIVARHPQLYSRLLQIMYSPSQSELAEAPEADPLSREMSPRSLAMYRELLAFSKDEDH
ncbi:MAG: hypothetical protein JWP59_4530 [Massilia sp.]|jgi:SAM-dependent methyltransferase|nr:hypothetical protein [Massilia sp.]